MPCTVLKSLVITVIINTWPRADTPAVIKLPIHWTVTSAFISSPMLRCVCYTFILSNLRKINHILKILRQIKARSNIVNHFIITVCTFLVGIKHLIIKRIVTLMLGKNINWFHIRQTFKTEFAAKTSHTLAVIIHRL